MEKIKVFMVMPFSDGVANDNYNHSIKPICESLNLEVNRADEISGTSPVYDDIVKSIQESSIIIADVTGKNPNVYYELGVAHTIKQDRTIIITQDDFGAAPFDIQHFRIIQYKNSIESTKKFKADLENTLSLLLKDRTESFKNEFNHTLKIFSGMGKPQELIRLIGIRKYNGSIKATMPVEVEGKYPGGEASGFDQEALQAFKTSNNLGYISFENNIVQLTEKGNYLVNYLIQKGYDCNLLADQTFTEGYIRLWNRKLKKQREDHLTQVDEKKFPTNMPQTHPDPS